jgi:zinc-finger of acetyl-transferase ESCO
MAGANSAGGVMPLSKLGRRASGVTTCWVCGLTYCTDVGSDVRVHNNRHRKAVAAGTALRGVGPCELPLSYTARERLKGQQTPPAEHLRLVMWSHFARSLDAAGFDRDR